MTYRLQCHIFYNLPAPSFEWFGANFQTLDPSRFSVDSNGELVISPVQGDDQMDFICRPSNAYGASTVAQFITVYVSPVVTLSRTEVIAILDSNLTVTCAATGRPSPQIEMFFPNGEPANSFVSLIVLSLSFLPLHLSHSSFPPSHSHSLTQSLGSYT